MINSRSIYFHKNVVTVVDSFTLNIWIYYPVQLGFFILSQHLDVESPLENFNSSICVNSIL